MTEAQPPHVPSAPTPVQPFGFSRGGSNSSGAWAIVGALLLALVAISSLTVRPHSVTDEDIRRAGHHMPHDRGRIGRN